MKLLSQLTISTITFVIVGPVIGAVALLLITVIGVSPAPQQASETALTTIALFAVGLVPTYLIGVIPAAAAGIMFGLIHFKYRLSHTFATVIGLLIGYSATSLLVMHFWSEWSIVGAASGAVSGLVATTAISVVGPNNSFKPKPLRGSA